MGNNQTDIRQAEEDKKDTFFSMALIPDDMPLKTANILITAIWNNSEQVAAKYAVSGGYVRNLIAKNRGLYNRLVEHKNVILAGKAESAMSKALELVNEGLDTMAAPTTPSQAMALVQAVNQLTSIRNNVDSNDTLQDNKAKLEKGLKAAQRLISSDE